MKRINNYTYVFFLTMIVFTLSSCLKDTDAEKRKAEQQQINNYVVTHGITAQPFSNGLYYIEEEPGYGIDSLKYYSDYAYISYRAWTLDGKMFDSSDTIEAHNNGVQYPTQKIGGPLKVSMQSGFIGLVQGLSHMVEGTKATLIIPSSLAYGDYVPRIYEVTLLKVVRDIKSYEMQILADSVLANQKMLADSTTYGSYVFATPSDTTGHPVVGDSVLVKYNGTILDGRVFQNYSTIRYKVGTFQIAGFDEAVMLMKKGSKAKVFIPYYRAFGTSSTLDYYSNQILVPPYSTIRFDIELVGIGKKGTVIQN
jgi:FKBP-type peptidyl-prolyl cis-trans isomerase